jgi:hypothetical protein
MRVLDGYLHLGQRITQLCTLLEVWVLGVGMSTIDTQTVVHRVSGDPSTDDPGT